MRARLSISALLVFACAAQTTQFALQVRDASLAGRFDIAQSMLKQVRDRYGTPPQYIEALAWIGRGELNAKNYAAAEQNAAEVRKLCLDQLAKRKLDADAALPLALGASIEVQALAATAQGRRDEAMLFLRQELKRWYATSIRARIQKNLNLLTLEGKPAPPIQIAEALTSTRLTTLAAHRGHPVLLFFWAHWCSDCKGEISIIQALEQQYGKRGLTVIAPTQHYGYVAGGQDAPRAAETEYIKSVFRQYYAGLGNVEVPVSEENFANYGVSTTPTLVLVDKNGIVRLYNPGVLSYNQLAARIAPLV
ncbi:MAG: redoxin domain-containing protein [Acidobacteriota bacterium]|nr:redoxin domain-containing protein [Acidobacteriota bacterium]